MHHISHQALLDSVSHVKDGDIELLHVNTNLQDADYMTKGLPCQTFESNRFRTQGW